MSCGSASLNTNKNIQKQNKKQQTQNKITHGQVNLLCGKARGAIMGLSRVLSCCDCWDAGFAAVAVVGPVAGEAGGVYGADALSTLAQRCGRQRGGGGGGG